MAPQINYAKRKLHGVLSHLQYHSTTDIRALGWTVFTAVQRIHSDLVAVCCSSVCVCVCKSDSIWSNYTGNPFCFIFALQTKLHAHFPKGSQLIRPVCFLYLYLVTPYLSFGHVYSLAESGN